MISIENVSKIYNKHRRNQNIVLHETSLELPDEGFVFFIGQSGTGKSTMLNAIGGLISYEGQILFDKNKVDIEQYRKRNIGYIFQNFLIFEEMSVYENIQVALNLIGIYDQEEIHARTRTLLSAVELDINPNRRAGALSLGQRQRVAIARALASNPKIILADEPTGNLDSKNSIIVMNILKKLSKTHLVICVTHNLGLVNKYADHTFKIDEKKLVGFDKNASEEISSSNVTQNINVANMSVDEYKDENFLIKLYTQDSDKKDENNQIKIVRQNGRILVIGDNISIATKEEIQLESKKEDEKNTISSKENNEGIDLNFEERKDKKTFADSGFSKVIHKKIYDKHTFKSFLVGASNVVFPLIIFVLFNLMISQVNSLADTNLAPLHEDYIYLASTDNKDRDAVTGDVVAELCNDPESGIVDVATPYPFASTAETSISTTNSLSLSEFNFADDIISPVESFADKYINYSIKDINDFASFDEFKDVDTEFGDNDIYISSAIENQISTAFGNNNVAFANQKTLTEELEDSAIDFDHTNWDNSTIVDSYKIKGIIESDLPYIFANTETYLHFNLFENRSNNFSASYYKGVLEAFDFVEYDDIKNDNSRYEVFISPDDESVLSEYSILPLCYTSENIDLENIGLPYFPTMQSYIVDKENPDAQVICFRDYNIDETTVDSSALFLSEYVGIIFNSGDLSTVPEGLQLSSGKLPEKIGEVMLPESYSSFELTSNTNVVASYFNYTITGYYDDSEMDIKPVYCSSSQIESLFFPEAFISIYQENLGDLLSPYNNALLTTDAEKTKAYLTEHQELGLTSYTYDSIFSEFNPNPLASTIQSLAIAIGVLGGIFVGIIIISNFGGVNKDKYKFGVLRCLGYSKKDIFKENSSTILANGIFDVIVPCLLFTVIMLCFNVYSLGFLWTFVFYLAYLLVLLVSSNIPLLILLRKKPVDIIGSLN